MTKPERKPYDRGMLFLSKLKSSTIFIIMMMALPVYGIAPKNTQKAQINAVAPGGQVQVAKPSGDGVNHATAMGFANSEVKWGVLRSLAKGPKGETLIKDPKLKKIINSEIKLKGYMLPLDFSKKEVKEFLLLPYIPSCMHIPPPPSTQIIHVKMNKGHKAKQTYFPVEVKGILKVQENKEYESSYLMAGLNVLELDPAKQKEINNKNKKAKKK